MESVICFEASIFTYKNESRDDKTDDCVDTHRHEKIQISNLRVRGERGGGRKVDYFL
jgi:hypothetical protein